MRHHLFKVVIGLIAAVGLLTGCSQVEKLRDNVEDRVGLNEPSEPQSLVESAKTVKKATEDFTPEQEYYIGRAVAANVLAEYDALPDAEVNAYLNRLGQALAMASDMPETFTGYHFLVVDSDEINAFAAPSGFILVSRGMLHCTSDEPTLAAVLAHEIGHVQSRHGIRSIKKSRVTAAVSSVALTAVQEAGPEQISKLASVFDDSILDITSTLMNSGYSRAFEREADAAAVAILKRMGYDPHSLIQMLEVMEERLDPEGPGFARTHPAPQDRIDDIQQMIGESDAVAGATPAMERRYRDALGNM
jgi:predicted Zn-dependent protease